MISARKSKNMPLVCCQKKTKLSNIELYLYSSNCDKLRSHFQTEPIELKTDFRKASVYYHVPTKGVIEPKISGYISKMHVAYSSDLVFRNAQKPHNCTEIHCERWFLSFMEFSVYKVVRARPLSVASLTNQLRN